MYKIIGADEREYGPITADQIRRWIAEGRANGQTKAQAEGSSEWKPLSGLPEFREALAAKPPPPFAASGPATVDTDRVAEQMAEQIISRDSQVEIGRCISRSWELVKANFWLTVGAVFVVSAIECALGAIPILGAAASMVMAGAFQGGLFHLFLKLIRGQPAGIEDAFAGFKLAFVPLMLAGIVVSVLSSLGFLLCILPGIYLAVAWVFTFPLVIDRRLEFWPAMELGRKVVTQHWWTVFGLLVVNFLVCVLGVLCCLVGVFVALPVTIGALAYAYDDIFGDGSTLAAA
ncbi:MAG: GYF domain-containing protein [Limisphaerales bacterium]